MIYIYLTMPVNMALEWKFAEKEGETAWRSFSLCLF